MPDDPNSEAESGEEPATQPQDQASAPVTKA